MHHPFFILGTGRCGSTRLYRILREHPQVGLTDEAKLINLLYFVTELAAKSVGEPGEWNIRQVIRMEGMTSPVYTESIGSVVRDHVRLIVEDFYSRQFPDKDITHWGDKLPDPQAARAVQHLWPSTRFLLMVRDPRDMWCSYASFREVPEVREKLPQLDDLQCEGMAHVWRNLYSTCLDWLEPLHVVRYEQLVSDPRGEAHAVLRFLDLATDPAVEQEIDGTGNFAGHGTSASPKASIGRWQRDASPDDLQTIHSICGDVMERLGYSIEESGR